MFISGTYHAIHYCGTALLLDGFRILNDISWAKRNAPPNLGCRCFADAHETLIWALKTRGSRYCFNYEDMKGGNWHESDEFKNAGSQMRTVWAINTPGGGEKLEGKYPTMKPLSLCRRMVAAATVPGMRVLDPFTGSSGFGLVAKQMGRDFVGIDLSPEGLDLSVRRHNRMFVSDCLDPKLSGLSGEENGEGVE